MENRNLTDTELLDELEKMDGFALVSDINGHWALVGALARDETPWNDDGDLEISCDVEAHQWKNSIREAIDAELAE